MLMQTLNHSETFVDVVDFFHVSYPRFLSLLAFRAILAEPRTKNSSADNDYFSNQRSDHAGNEPGLSAYPFGVY